MRRKIAILGATGSIGKSTLDLVERSPERFDVVAVTAATNAEALAEIARRTGARLRGGGGQGACASQAQRRGQAQPGHQEGRAAAGLLVNHGVKG